jgi:hypothetical protein
MSDGVERAQVEDRLAREAAQFDALHGGVHKFNNIRRFSSPTGANWTANFGVRGGSMSLRTAVELTYMHEMLRKVQADMPEIRFDGD